MMRASALALALTLGCKPASVETVDSWLRAYAEGRIEDVIARTHGPDQALIEKALKEQLSNPTGTYALMLPPKPISHEFEEIEDKPSDSRHIILTRVRSKNPLPFASKRVGQVLDKIPKTRSQYRRFLVVREGDRWGVKLDLPAVFKRTEFVQRFTELVSKGSYEQAKAMLKAVPPPPDEANAQKKKDRLTQTLTADLEKAKKAAEAAKKAAQDQGKSTETPGG